MVPLFAFRTHRHIVFLAEHRQWLVVASAEVTAGEGGRIRQPVALQGWIPQVRCEVNVTVRHLADEARLDRCRLVSLADVAGNFGSFGDLVRGLFHASR